MFTRAQLERAANVKLSRGWILDGPGPARYGWTRVDTCKKVWLGRTLTDAALALKIEHVPS